ncbi:MAG: efflux RND transporter periplasmic adaptor subunit [Gammaproteobacteria bacterium]|nr:efflux RND transporter periplasmic adaptor subunit [Gammaproteobacteria bacterium]
MIEGTDAQDKVIQPAPVYRKWLIVGGLVLVILVLVVLTLPMMSRWLQADLSVSAERVRIGTVTREDLVHDVSVQAVVVAGDSPTLYSEHAGNIQLDVNVGDRVGPQQVVAHLANPEIHNLLDQEISNYSRLAIEVEREEILNKQQALENQRALDVATVQLTAAKREARRAAIAHSSDAISDIDLETANDELTSAQFTFDHAKSFLALDQERMDFELRTKRLSLERQGLMVENLERQAEELRIRSPVAGIVGNIDVDQRTNIMPGQKIMTIVDVSLFELDAQVPQSYADDIDIGMRAEVTIDGSNQGATVTSISPEILDNQVLVRMKFEGEPPMDLRRNQRVNTRIVLREIPDVLVVPRGQFLSSGGGRIAYVIDDESIARRTSIQTGAQGSSSVEITQGLSAGDRIILSNTESFQDYASVLITQ